MKRSGYCIIFTLMINLVLLHNLISQSRPVVFQGAEIYPVSGEPIREGIIILHEGKIAGIGQNGQLAIPENAEIHDVQGKVIIPGLVDSHSHVGGGDGGDNSLALHPDVRIMDAIDSRHDTFMKAIAGGITTVNVMPGSGHLMSGQTVYLKLRERNSVQDMLLFPEPESGIYGGLKMANGTNSIRGNQPFPGTRAKSAALVREEFVKALNYKKKIDDAQGNADKMPDRDLKMETLVEVLEKKRKVHFHTHRHDDIQTILRLTKEFDFRVVLHHVSEAYLVADEIAAAGIPCSIISLDSPGGKLEAAYFKNISGAELERAGALVAFHTDDPVNDSRLFLRSAALGIRNGMSPAKALDALTLAGAKIMDLDHRVGSLDKGKDADIVVLSGAPFSVYTHVEQTWVEGVMMFDRSNPEHKKYAVGGYRVYKNGYSDHGHGGLE